MKKTEQSSYSQRKTAGRALSKLLYFVTKPLMAVAIFMFYVLVPIIPSYGQSAKISLNMKDVTIAEVLNKIEEQTQYHFLFTSSLVDLSSKTELKVSNKSINEVLELLFGKTQIKYTVQDWQIILTPKATEPEVKDKQETDYKRSDYR